MWVLFEFFCLLSLSLSGEVWDMAGRSFRIKTKFRVYFPGEREIRSLVLERSVQVTKGCSWKSVGIRMWRVLEKHKILVSPTSKPYKCFYKFNSPQVLSVKPMTLMHNLLITITIKRFKKVKHPFPFTNTYTHVTRKLINCMTLFLLSQQTHPQQHVYWNENISLYLSDNTQDTSAVSTRPPPLLLLSLALIHIPV
jgi:hypothetical protein